MTAHWLAFWLLAAAPELTGRWEGGGFTLVLANNGSGSISDGPQVPLEPLRWKLTGAVLQLTQDADAFDYQVKLAGDTLTLSSVVLDAPLTVRRSGAKAKRIPMVELGPGRLGQRLELHYGAVEWHPQGPQASLHRWHGQLAESEEVFA